jgi:hypothetical protein
MEQIALNFGLQDNRHDFSATGKIKLRKIEQLSAATMTDAPNEEQNAINHHSQGQPGKTGESYVV